MTITCHRDLIQGTPDWFAARCGLLTASEMKLIITAKQLKYSDSEKERTHLYELLSQRVTQYVEPSYISDTMLRGKADEIYAREEYIKHFAPVEEVGFVTNDKWGFTLGYSPDGMVDEDGQIESKSRCQKYQIETILNNTMPDDYLIQVQTGLLVTERKWCDFISYSGGMHMVVIRIHADPKIQDAILAAARIFHGKMEAMLKAYASIIADDSRKLIPTERKIEQEIIV